MMKDKLLHLMIINIFCLMLAACTAVGAPALQPNTAAITLTDGLQRQVTLKSEAQKIVSLAPSNTEILFAIEAGNQIIGRDNFSDYPQEAQAIVTIGDFNGYNLESIVNMQPDLVLAAGLNTSEEVKEMEDAGLTVYYLSNPQDLEGLYSNLITVGTLTGHEVEAQSLITNLRQRADLVQKSLGSVTTRPKVFYELDGTDPSKPWTTGPGTFVDQWIRMAGGENIGASSHGEWVQLSQEEIIIQNPDIILLGDAIFGMSSEQVAARPGWAAIKAVKDGKVYEFNDDLVSRPGPRVVDGLIEMAKVIHPEIADDLK